MLTHAKGSFLYHFIQAFVAGHAFGHETRVVILAVGVQRRRPRSLTVTGIAGPISPRITTGNPLSMECIGILEIWSFLDERARRFSSTTHPLDHQQRGIFECRNGVFGLAHTSFFLPPFRHLSRFDPCWLLVQQN